MKHVNAIRKDIENGQTAEAYEALDNLLHLGPSNVAALKLKALLFNAEGRFRDEARVWNQIIEIDSEDEDAILYYQGQQLEDRELFYFTEDLPGGGRRYLAYPRAVFTTTIFALLGSLSFWFIQAKVLELPKEWQISAIYTAFMITVVTPVLFWLFHFLKALKYIDLTETGLTIRSQIKSIQIPWNDVEHACLRYGKDPNNPDLRLSIIPRTEGTPHILIDMNDHSSSVRARSYLLTEIERYLETFHNICETDMPTNDRKVEKY